MSDTLWTHGLDSSPPGSSVHGLLQARILEWVAISFFRGFSQPRDWMGLPHCRQILYCLSHQCTVPSYPFEFRSKVKSLSSDLFWCLWPKVGASAPITRTLFVDVRTWRAESHLRSFSPLDWYRHLWMWLLSWVLFSIIASFTLLSSSWSILCIIKSMGTWKEKTFDPFNPSCVWFPKLHLIAFFGMFLGKSLSNYIRLSRSYMCVVTIQIQ